MKVYVVRKNGDFTEGRGPMFLHKIFAKMEDARSYVSTQSGIYGSPQYLEGNRRNDGSESWNGYDISPQEVIEDFLMKEYEEKKLEIAILKEKVAAAEAELKEMEGEIS